MAKTNSRGYIRPYKTYLFRNKDPVIDIMRTAIADTGTRWSEIEKAGGPKTGTLHNWFRGDTKRPTFAASNAAMRAIGKQFVLVDYLVRGGKR